MAFDAVGILAYVLKTFYQQNLPNKSLEFELPIETTTFVTISQSNTTYEMTRNISDFFFNLKETEAIPFSSQTSDKETTSATVVTQQIKSHIPFYRKCNDLTQLVNDSLRKISEFKLYIKSQPTDFGFHQNIFYISTKSLLRRYYKAGRKLKPLKYFGTIIRSFYIITSEQILVAGHRYIKPKGGLFMIQLGSTNITILNGYKWHRGLNVHCDKDLCAALLFWRWDNYQRGYVSVISSSSPFQQQARFNLKAATLTTGALNGDQTSLLMSGHQIFLLVDKQLIMYTTNGEIISEIQVPELINRISMVSDNQLLLATSKSMLILSIETRKWIIVEDFEKTVRDIICSDNDIFALIDNSERIKCVTWKKEKKT